MKTFEMPLVRFLEGHDKRFVIPVYQRNYDWNIGHCKRLFDDLVELATHPKRKSHFFGTIFSLYNEDSDEGQEFVIIDGQQRVTTVSLLMLALVHEFDDRGEEGGSHQRNVIYKQYLTREYKEDVKIKLKPIKDDAAAFDALFDNNPEGFVSPSNITINYNYFRDAIKSRKLTPGVIYEAVRKLHIVEIQLTSGDENPQLIFESLNSTGLDLSESDKARNFVLMGLKSEKQEEYYEKYWSKIEKLTHYHASDFLRDFLTFKNSKAPNKNNIYAVFKDYAKPSMESDTEEMLKELLQFAEYYNKILESKHSDAGVAEILGYLNRLNKTVIYPFLLELFDDNNKNILDNESLRQMLSIIESFVVRRWICDVPTNVLNKLFMAFGKSIKNDDNYKDNYVDIFKYILSQRRLGQRFPTDEDVKRKMLDRDFYNFKNKFHVFERLEYYNNRERLAYLQELKKREELSVQHIMPIKLSPRWKKDLGENWEDEHSKYLHNIGNLTLTAYNTEMSNKPFQEKKNLYYADSPLFLNCYVKNQDEWNSKKIIERAKLLADRALDIWKYASTDYESARNVGNVYSLEEEVDFTHTKIASYQFLGGKDDIKVNHWVDFYVKMCKNFYELAPTEFEEFLRDPDFSNRIISRDKTTLDSPREISAGIYVKTKYSVKNLLNWVRKMLRKLRIDESEVTITLKESEPAQSKSTRSSPSKRPL